MTVRPTACAASGRASSDLIVCGIVGIFALEGSVPHEDLWGDMANHLRHRGPDEGAFWADGPFFLATRRLAIIDIEHGGQPMASADGNIVVVCNGEIYNYIELREELKQAGCRFRTASDVEVLVHGYQLWGAGLPERLKGMFAFAIADRRARSLLLARDRFGEKPLFVARVGRYIAFASEVKPLTVLPELDRAVDQEALGGFLSLNYVPGERTLLENVRRLAPAHWMRVDANGTTSGAYWTPPVLEAAGRPTFAEAECELRARLDHAVKMCLRSDVPVGIFLSGGIDSSLIAESAVRQGRLTRAYVACFDERTFSEEGPARLVADRLGIPLEPVLLQPSSLGHFLELVDHADDPLADSSALAVWQVSQAASRQHKVVLTGDGSDEVFGGYQTYPATLAHERVVSRLPAAARRGLSALAGRIPVSEGKASLSYKLRRFLRAAELPTGLAHFSWNGTWLPSEAVQIASAAARGAVAAAMPAVVSRAVSPHSSPLLRFQLADIAEYLANDILVKTDRMSMAHGLETRAPFLYPDVVEFGLRLPDHLKVGRFGRLKCLLRAAARRHFGPAIADRAKQGFSIPVHAWLRRKEGEPVRDLLARDSVRATGILDAGTVEALVNDHMAGRGAFGFELWGLAVLVAWHRLRVARGPSPPPPDLLIRRVFAATHE